MKLYDGQAPNPWRVRVFLHEKGLEIPMKTLQIFDGDTRAPDFLKLNSLGELPVLELDDGNVITESVAICRYLETLTPEPALFGSTPLEVGQIEMWHRRMELNVVSVIGSIGLHTIPFFAEKVEQVPEYAETLFRALPGKWQWLDEELADGRSFLAGEKFSVADITGMMALKICDILEQSIGSEYSHVKAWEDKVRGRPSWNA